MKKVIQILKHVGGLLGFTLIFMTLFGWGWHLEVFQKYATGSLDRVGASAVLAEDGVPELSLHGLDWFPPVFTISGASQTLTYSGTELVITSSEAPAAYTIPSSWKLIPVVYGDLSSPYTYVLKTGDMADGSFSEKITFTDKYDNSSDESVNLIAPAGRLYSPEWENIQYFLDANNIYAIANKEFRLLSSYVPPDLVSLSSLGITNYNYGQLRSEAATQMQAMTRAISNAGIFYVITSSYRSYETQIHTYNYWYMQTGYDRTATDLKSARPGYSEHQLGVTVDFASNQTNFVTGSSLDSWLKAHAHEYGYVMSYPEGKQDITGYQYEPWHYRYVGVDAATAIKDSGLTPTEWLYDHWNVE